VCEAKKTAGALTGLESNLLVKHGRRRKPGTSGAYTPVKIILQKQHTAACLIECFIYSATLRMNEFHEKTEGSEGHNSRPTTATANACENLKKNNLKTYAIRTQIKFSQLAAKTVQTKSSNKTRSQAIARIADGRIASQQTI